MSISSAFSTAISGLTASSRMAEVVSSNIANAMTEGYARRELSLSAETLGGQGGGVRIQGIQRIVNETLLQDKRLADAASANTSAKTAFYERLETQIGNTETEGSLSWTMTEFESALVSAASMPDSSARLRSAIAAAGAIVTKITAISDDLQQTRLKADQSIANQVRSVNETLVQLQKLNRTITTQISVGNDAAGLMDERQSLIQQISEIVPLKVVQRDNNQIALFTTGGAILLDGSAAQLGFDAAGIMTPERTYEGAQLSGITLNGRPVSTNDSGPLGGGTLGAAFAVRDVLATEAQAKLDAVTANLVNRFQGTAVDPTLTASDAGIFTDADLAFNSTKEVGLSGRLTLNKLLDPAQGGDTWRLRDGLAAAAPGPVSDGSLLNALTDALKKEISPVSGDFGDTKRSAAGLTADFLSFASSERQSAELTQGYATARKESLTEMALSDGVDTDHEMQTLLVVEKAYAANAKVIQAIDDMLKQLLEL